MASSLAEYCDSVTSIPFDIKGRNKNRDDCSQTVSMSNEAGVVEPERETGGSKIKLS